MIHAEYIGDASHPLLTARQEDRPYTFLREYHDFERSLGNRIVFLIDEGQAIYAPVRIRKSLFLRRAEFLFHPLKQGAEISAFEERRFLEEAVLYLKNQMKVHSILQSTPLFGFQSVPEGSVWCPVGTYRIDLQLPEESIFGLFRASHKYEIRKAKEAAVAIKTGRQQVADFFSLFSETMKRAGSESLSLRHLLRFYDALDPHLICAVAYREGWPLSAALIPYTRFAGYYLYGASGSSPKVPGANKLLLWEIMRKLRNEGVNDFILGGARLKNFAGTRFEQIQFFKEGFGPQKISGFLWKQALHPLPVRAYHILLQARFRMLGKKPVPDLIDSYHSHSSNG